MGTENESALTQNAMVGKLNDLSRNKHIQSSVKQFQGGDKDHSNNINMEEFFKMAQNIPVLRGKDEAILEETFRKIDVDASGGLNISEFHSFYAELKMLKKTSNVTPYPDIDLKELKGFPYYRKYIWVTFDTYDTRVGKICGPIIFFLIFLSVVSYCLESIPKLNGWVGWNNIDAGISIVFTIEFVLRLCTTWNMREFGTSLLNIIDLCSFLPYYIELILDLSSDKNPTRFDWLRVLRICRLMKILRISTYINSCLIIFGETIILAKDSFMMLLNVTILSTLVLSALVYSAEEDATPKTFQSVFEAIYWCVVTQTTLGYGDINVITPVGRLFACVTAVVGIMNLAFMINLVGSCFDEAYTRFLTREEQDFKKRLESQMDHAAQNTQIFAARPQERKMRRISRFVPNMEVFQEEGNDIDTYNSLAECVADLNFRLVQMQESPQSFYHPSSKSKLMSIMAKTRGFLGAELLNRDHILNENY